MFYNPFFAQALAFVYLLLQTKINSINYNRRRKERELPLKITDHKSLHLNAAFVVFAAASLCGLMLRVERTLTKRSVAYGTFCFRQ